MRVDHQKIPKYQHSGHGHQNHKIAQSKAMQLMQVTCGTSWRPNFQLMQVAPPRGQFCKQCECRHLMAKFENRAVQVAQLQNIYTLYNWKPFLHRILHTRVTSDISSLTLPPPPTIPEMTKFFKTFIVSVWRHWVADCDDEVNSCLPHASRHVRSKAFFFS